MTRRIWRSEELVVVAIDDQLWVIDATGRITQRYRPERDGDEPMLFCEEITYSIDDTGALVRRKEWSGLQEGSALWLDTMLDGLVPVDDPDTRRFVQTVLDDDAVAAEERRARDARALD